MDSWKAIIFHILLFSLALLSLGNGLRVDTPFIVVEYIYHLKNHIILSSQICTKKKTILSQWGMSPNHIIMA